MGIWRILGIRDGGWVRDRLGGLWCTFWVVVSRRLILLVKVVLVVNVGVEENADG
jgi:hypothetical protein